MKPTSEQSAFPNGTKIGITDRNGKEIKVGDKYRTVYGVEGVVKYPANNRDKTVSAFCVNIDKQDYLIIEGKGEVI